MLLGHVKFRVAWQHGEPRALPCCRGQYLLKPRQHGKSWVLPCWHGRSILFPHQHGKSRLYHVAAAAPFPSPCQHGKCTGLPCCHDPSQPSHAATLLTQSLGHLVGKAECAAFVKHWPKMVSKKLLGSILEGLGEGSRRIWEGRGRILTDFWMDFNKGRISTRVLQAT